MEMFVSLARLVRISSYNNDNTWEMIPQIHFMSSDSPGEVTNAQKSLPLKF